jgi:NAD(P)-dependent dehydrogenase (short-subunit alcohol dehydrogenase family)
VALAFTAAGYAVSFAGRREEALQAAAKDSGAGADRVLAVPTDVTDPASVRQLFRRTQEKFGRVDVLFNNAGVSAPGMSLEELPVEKWREVIDTNLTGAFLCTQEAVRMMKAQAPRGGRIINNGSIAAHVPRPNSAPYAAAKHGVSGLTKATALEGRAFDIACGQIDIGNADTAMASNVKRGSLQANGTTAIEPTIELKHVADAVLYMAGLPLSANVLSLTVMATGMPYVGRG